MEKYKNIAFTLLIAFSVFGLIFAIYSGVKETNKQAKEYALYQNKISACLLKNEDKYKKFIIDCVSSLKVEENAYAIDSCSDKAKFLYCGYINSD